MATLLLSAFSTAMPPTTPQLLPVTSPPFMTTLLFEAETCA